MFFQPSKMHPIRFASWSDIMLAGKASLKIRENGGIGRQPLCGQNGIPFLTGSPNSSSQINGPIARGSIWIIGQLGYHCLARLLKPGKGIVGGGDFGDLEFKIGGFDRPDVPGDKNHAEQEKEREQAEEPKHLPAGDPA